MLHLPVDEKVDGLSNLMDPPRDGERVVGPLKVPWVRCWDENGRRGAKKRRREGAKTPWASGVETPWTGMRVSGGDGDTDVENDRMPRGNTMATQFFCSLFLSLSFSFSLLLCLCLSLVSLPPSLLFRSFPQHNGDAMAKTPLFERDDGLHGDLGVWTDGRTGGRADGWMDVDGCG